MSYAWDEAIDELNHHHLVDCDATDGGHCTCDELEISCAA